MPRLFSIKPSLTYKGRKFKGIRGWAGKPTHPPLTDVPVTCYVLVGLADFVSWFANIKGGEPGPVARDLFVTGTYLICAGAIVSLPTSLTGFWDWLKSTPKHSQAWRTANAHMATMAGVTLLVIINIVMRLNDYAGQTHAEAPVMVLSVLIMIFVSFGALLGGTMVYEYAFNVEQDIDYAYEASETDKLPGAGPLE